MQAIMNFFERFRVFKRIAILEETLQHTHATTIANSCDVGDAQTRVQTIENFISSREPCNACGHHRYKQKTLHYDDCHISMLKRQA